MSCVVNDLFKKFGFKNKQSCLIEYYVHSD